MQRTLCALALLCAGTAQAALEARDFNTDGTVDAYYDTAADLTWADNPRPLQDYLRSGDSFEVASVAGWQLPTAAQLDSLVFGALGNTDESFQSVATLKTGPFVAYYGFVVQEGAYEPFAQIAQKAWNVHEEGWMPIRLYTYSPAWLVQQGDVGGVGAVSPAPEPSTWALMVLGFAALLWRRSSMQRSTALTSRSLPAAR